MHHLCSSVEAVLQMGFTLLAGLRALLNTQDPDCPSGTIRHTLKVYLTAILGHHSTMDGNTELLLYFVYKKASVPSPHGPLGAPFTVIL